MPKRYEPVDPAGVRTYPLASRPSKVRVEDAARPWRPGGTLQAYLESLPNQLAVRSLRDVVEAILAARVKGKPVIVGLGAHVIKVGLSPILIDLAERGVVTAVALNGACAVHDFELYQGTLPLLSPYGRAPAPRRRRCAAGAACASVGCAVPRGPRLDAPDTLHHVMVRGLERRAIFRDDTDRADFVARLAALAESGALTVYAWALLPNHAHLLVRTGSRPLPRSMRSLLTPLCGGPSIGATTGSATSSRTGTSRLW